MKRYLLKIFLAAISALFIQGSLNASNDIWADITAALKQGNNAALTPYLCDKTELSINKTETTGKKPVETALANFFQQNKPSNFIIKHKGNSKAGSQFTVGDLTTSNGNYRVQMVVQAVDGKSTIMSIEIEKQ